MLSAEDAANLTLPKSELRRDLLLYYTASQVSRSHSSYIVRRERRAPIPFVLGSPPVSLAIFRVLERCAFAKMRGVATRRVPAKVTELTIQRSPEV